MKSDLSVVCRACEEFTASPLRALMSMNPSGAMKPAHDSSTLQAAIRRNFSELNKAILKLTAHDRLIRQNITYRRISFFVLAEQALYNDILAHAMRVLDEHRDAMSFWYVLRCNEAAIKKAARAAELDLGELRVLSEKLRLIREKTQFHIDRRSVTAPEAVWTEADILGSVFSKALEGTAATLARTKKDLFGGELETVTEYDGSDVARIIKAYEIVHGSVHGG